MRWQSYTARFVTGGFFRAKIDRTKMDATLKHLDEEGWELVTITPVLGYRGATSELLGIFKRPLTSEASEPLR